MMLLAHTDVVPAPPTNWSVPPFEGRIADGRLVGRGAVDMKSELAARVVAVAALARSGARPDGDVILIAEADEERNTAEVGMSWLVRERPDLRCDYAINEGAGNLLELAGRPPRADRLGGGEAGPSLRVRVFGRAGHASIPIRADEPAPPRGDRGRAADRPRGADPDGAVGRHRARGDRGAGRVAGGDDRLGARPASVSGRASYRR